MTRIMPTSAPPLPDTFSLPTTGIIDVVESPPQRALEPEPRAEGSVFGTVLTLGGIQGCAMLFIIARSKAVALTLGPSGVGAISVIDQIVGLAGQVATFSLPFAAVKFLSAAHSDGRDAFARMYAAFLWALLTLSVVGSGASMAVLRWWPRVLGPELAGYGFATTLALLSIPGTTLVGFFTNAIASTRRTRTAGFYGLVNVAALAVLSTVGVAIGGVQGYYAGGLAVISALTIGGFIYLSRSEGVAIGRPQTGLQQLRRCRGVAGFAASLYVMSFALPAAHLLARYAILRVSGLEAAGLLQSAMALGLAFAMVMRQSNALLLTPAMNRNTPPDQKFREAADYLRTFSLVAGAVALPLVLFPDMWLYILYSPRFLTAAPYAYLFVLAQVFQLFAGVALGVLVGLDRIGTQLSVTLTGLAVMAFLSWSLAPTMGIAGIGAAFLAEGVLVLVLSTWTLWRRSRFAILKNAEWLPVAVLAVLAVTGAVAARYRSVAAEAFGIKLATWALLTAGSVAFAWRRGLLDEWLVARRIKVRRREERK